MIATIALYWLVACALATLMVARIGWGRHAHRTSHVIGGRPAAALVRDGQSDEVNAPHPLSPRGE